MILLPTPRSTQPPRWAPEPHLLLHISRPLKRALRPLKPHPRLKRALQNQRAPRYHHQHPQPRPHMAPPPVNAPSTSTPTASLTLAVDCTPQKILFWPFALLQNSTCHLQFARKPYPKTQSGVLQCHSGATLPVLHSRALLPAHPQIQQYIAYTARNGVTGIQKETTMSSSGGTARPPRGAAQRPRPARRARPPTTRALNAGRGARSTATQAGPARS